ncbi:MAG: SRPBCC family protein [Candidatus Saccharibacteria bacterium]
MTINIHERDLKCSVTEAGALLDSLASPEDRLWPHEKWPPMILDKPLGEGAGGGHGPIGYYVEEYQPGNLVRFRFTNPPGFLGTHTFTVDQSGPGVVRIRHVIDAQIKGMSYIMWILAIRWLHDALLEDAFDKAEAYIRSEPWRPRVSSGWVRFLLSVMKRRARKQAVNA